jgi:hypothetical protein
MKRKKKTEPMPIYPDHTLKEKLRAEALENQRSMNGQIIFILEQYFKQQKPSKEAAGGNTNQAA